MTTPHTAQVLVVMGVAGTGKSTLAGALADRLGWALQEGDDLHPRRNVEKMASGHPLTDEDRWPWLDLIADWIDHREAIGEPGIITCSALRRRYRDILRRDFVTFVHLVGDRALILERMSHRQGHFMPTALLDSQFDTLEVPTADERAVTVDLSASPEEQVDAVIAFLGLSPAQPGRDAPGA